MMIHWLRLIFANVTPSVDNINCIIDDLALFMVIYRKTSQYQRLCLRLIPISYIFSINHVIGDK